MAYALADDLKGYLRIPLSQTDDDARMDNILEAVSKEIDHYCSRRFVVAGASPADKDRHLAKPYWHKRAREWRIDIPDLPTEGEDLEVLAWSEADQDWTTPVTLGAFPFRPFNSDLIIKPYTAVSLGGSSWPSVGYCGPRGSADGPRDQLLALGYFGWLVTPEQVIEATLLQSSRIFRRRDAIFGIVASPDGSSQSRLRQALDADVLLMLDGLIRYWAAR